MPNNETWEKKWRKYADANDIDYHSILCAEKFFTEQLTLARREELEKEYRRIWKFGTEQGWDNQVMTDLRNFLAFPFDPSSLSSITRNEETQ